MFLLPLRRTNVITNKCNNNNNNSLLLLLSLKKKVSSLSSSSSSSSSSSISSSYNNKEGVENIRLFSTSTTSLLRDEESVESLEKLQQILICDPHFHIWDTINNLPNSNLGDLGERCPIYDMKDYRMDMSALRLVSANFVETIIGQSKGGDKINTLKETEYVVSQMKRNNDVKWSITPYTDLLQENAEEILWKHLEMGGLDGTDHTTTDNNNRKNLIKSIRMILNYDDHDKSLCWPQVPSNQIMSNGIFKRNFQILHELDLVFDMQLNYHQLHEASQFLENKDNRVVLNHFGLPRLYHTTDNNNTGKNKNNDDEIDKIYKIWYDGMQRLSKNPNVYVKLSMFPWMLPDFWKKPSSVKKDHKNKYNDRYYQLQEMVNQIIDDFGVHRCMFASNYPVDGIADGLSIEEMYICYEQWTRHRDEKERKYLFKDTAESVYRL